MARLTKREKDSFNKFNSCIHSGWAIELELLKDLKRTHTGYCNEFDYRLDVVSVCFGCIKHKSYRERPVHSKTEPQKARIAKGRQQKKTKFKTGLSISEFAKKYESES